MGTTIWTTHTPYLRTNRTVPLTNFPIIPSKSRLRKPHTTFTISHLPLPEIHFPRTLRFIDSIYLSTSPSVSSKTKFLQHRATVKEQTNLRVGHTSDTRTSKIFLICDLHHLVPQGETQKVSRIPSYSASPTSWKPPPQHPIFNPSPLSLGSGIHRLPPPSFESYTILPNLNPTPTTPPTFPQPT